MSKGSQCSIWRMRRKEDRKKGITTVRKKASQLLQRQALVACDGLCKEKHHIHEQAAQRGQRPPVIVDPEGNQPGQYDGVAGDAGMLQKAGGPEHLMHRDHGQPGNEEAQSPRIRGRNQVKQHQQERDENNRHHDSLTHSDTSKTAGTALVGRQRPMQLLFGKIGPQYVSKIEFRIGGLPQQEVGNAHFPLGRITRSGSGTPLEQRYSENSTSVSSFGFRPPAAQSAAKCRAARTISSRPP